MKKEKNEKTNVMRALEQAKIPYECYYYDHEDGVIDGVGVANKLGQDPKRVFKTLVTRGKSGGLFVFCIPVEKELDLKKCAKAVGEKSVEMIHVKELLDLTGYIRGGCSPIGMKKAYPTVVDATCLDGDYMIFSAGKIGTQVQVKPEDLLKLVRAKAESITME